MLEAYEKDDGKFTPGMGLSLRVCHLEALERAPSLGKLPGGGVAQSRLWRKKHAGFEV